MFNHVRTLLANLPPLNYFGGDGYIAEELIDPLFKPIDPLPSSVAAARSLLFGAAPDRDMVNYRCRQVLTVLHASQLADHVTSIDPRITYATGEDAVLMANALFAVRIISLGDNAELTTYGQPEAPDPYGQVKREYLVTAGATQHVTVNDGNTNLDLLCQFSGGVMLGLPLRGSGYSFRLSSVIEGQQWLIMTRQRPQWAMGDLVASLAMIGDGNLIDLFKGEGEPFVTWRNVWQRSTDLALRLGAFVLAMAARTEAASNGSV